MLTIKEQGLLIGIVKHSDKIIEKISKLTKEEFFSNEDYIEIVCFNILQIGELAKHFDISFTTKYNKIPWKLITGMRDKVAHGYDTINIDIVWGTANKDIKLLKEYCEYILSNNK